MFVFPVTDEPGKTKWLMTEAGTQPHQQTQEPDETIYNELILSLDCFGLPS